MVTSDSWHYWADCTSTSTTTDTWNTWNDSGTSTDTSWYSWVTTSDSNEIVQHKYYEQRESEAERLAREERLVAREERLEAQRERTRLVNEKREAVKKRALDLLHSILSEKQKRTLEKKGFFEIIGQSGKRYQIKDTGSMGNVIAVDFHGKNKKQRICAHPKLYNGKGSIPQGDVMLGQMMALQHDEKQFLKVANLH